MGCLQSWDDYPYDREVMFGAGQVACQDHAHAGLAEDLEIVRQLIQNTLSG
jgi:hypothetical protein